MKLINDGRIDQKLYTDYIVERPVLRYVFKSPAAKAERRGKVQDQIDDLRRRLAVADAAVFPLPFVQSDDDLTFGFIGVIGADGDKRPAMVVQIIDGNSAVVSFGLIGGGRKLLIEGVNTSSFKKHQPIPKSLPIWITGTRELPEQHGKPQSILTAKQFFPESYVIRNRPTTRPSSR